MVEFVPAYGNRAIVRRRRADGGHGLKGNAFSLMTTLAIPLDSLTVVATPPETLSQRNVEQVTGIPLHVFLETIHTPGFPLR
ncbi:hypothetical protein ACMHYB_43350 [Sorangium sp. So ce1128]